MSLHQVSRSRSRSPRWRKVSSRSRSRSRRRSRSARRSRSPKLHKSVRKHKSKSPRPRSPLSRSSRTRSPISLQRRLDRSNHTYETSLFAELVKNRNLPKEIATNAWQKAREAKERAANNLDDVQIIDGTDEQDATDSAKVEAKKSVELLEIPVPDAGDSGIRTPPLPLATSLNSSRLSTPTASLQNSPAPLPPAECPSMSASIAAPPPPPPPLPPQPDVSRCDQVPAPVPPMTNAVCTPAPLPVPSPAGMPNMSIPPPPVSQHPATSVNTALSKFNQPNNLVPIKTVDTNTSKAFNFKSKILNQLPMPPGINQNDLESIDSPPSRSPSPPNKKKTQTGTAKPMVKKGIKDLPMPPGNYNLDNCITCCIQFFNCSST